MSLASCTPTEQHTPSEQHHLSEQLPLAQHAHSLARACSHLGLIRSLPRHLLLRRLWSWRALFHLHVGLLYGACRETTTAAPKLLFDERGVTALVGLELREQGHLPLPMLLHDALPQLELRHLLTHGERGADPRARSACRRRAPLRPDSSSGWRFNIATRDF